MKTKHARETKIYTSERYTEDRLYFEVTTESLFHTYDEKPSVNSIEVSATLKCIAKVNSSHYSIVKHEGQTVWKLIANSERCSLENSVMIQRDCRAYGIGTFLLHNMLKKAIESFPQSELSCSLSLVDAYNFTQCIDGKNVEINNKHLRDSLYKKIGMIKLDNDDKFIIKHIKDLQIQEDFDFIKEVDIFEYLEQNIYQLKEIKSNKYLIKDITRELHIVQNKNTHLKKFIVLLLFFCFIFMLLFIN